jgi:hypothetical protein
VTEHTRAEGNGPSDASAEQHEQNHPSRLSVRFRWRRRIVGRVLPSILTQVAQHWLEIVLAGVGSTAWILVGLALGSIVALASGLGIWQRRRRARKSQKVGGSSRERSSVEGDPQPKTDLTTWRWEITRGVWRRLNSALSSPHPPRFGDFLCGSVLPFFVTKLKRLFAKGTDVEVAIFEVVPGKIDVVYGSGDCAEKLQNALACFIGESADLESTLAEKVESLFPGGDFVHHPIGLAPGREHYLIVVTSVPFPYDKHLIAGDLADMVQSASTAFAVLGRDKGPWRRILRRG